LVASSARILLDCMSLALTVDMERCQDDTVDGRHSGHKQCSGLTDSTNPLLLAGNYTDDDEDVVPVQHVTLVLALE
jgi:hypothetical protein